ncbi:protein CHROMATIN REMODELING 4-like isoform X2 [Aristolochia californica]|uniref:protein CHROMATIN REMODELING 4-like isoform X2 n=1 Tax=Aristolochia californica TaxID=171875 RepID=UPI0035DCC721
MKENGPLQDKMIEKNWVLKRKRKRVPVTTELTNGEDGVSTVPLEPLSNSSSAKRRLRSGDSISPSPQKRKGNDGYYYECVICDLGGNLLCCDRCPRTYHLQCLNPPLKRTPPGKWQCPKCCEQKESVKSVTPPPDSVSRRARTKASIKKLKTGSKTSGSGKSLSIGRSSILEKHKSSSSVKEKLTFACHASPVEEKSISQEMETNSTGKSSHSSFDGGFEETPSLPLDVQNSSRSLDSEPEAETRSPAKGLIVRFYHSAEKAKKNRQKIEKGDHKKKKSTAEAEKSVRSNLYTQRSGSRASSACPEIRNRRKRSSVDRHKSKEDRVVQKLTLQVQDKKPPEEISNSSTEFDGGTTVDKVAMYGEYILEGTQQVDRILGCRIRSSGSDNISITLENDSKVTVLKGAENKCIDGSDVNEEPTGEGNIHEEELSQKNILEEEDGVNKDDMKHMSLGEDCLEKKNVLAATNVPAEDQQYTEVNCETQIKSAINAVDIVDVTKNTVEKSSETNEANLEASANGITYNKQDLDLMQKNADPTPHEDIVCEFLVKWVGQSHVHNTWVSESQLKVLAKRKFENYKAKYGTIMINICQEQWTQPQRVIALRIAKNGTKEALIKWCGLPYDECTWERLDQPIMDKASHLIAEFELIESQTWEKEFSGAYPLKIKGDQVEIIPLMEQPKELKGGSLFAHQLEALNWLRKCWCKSKNVILADEMGLGKTVSACAFISSLYVEFKAKLPCLVLVPLSTMPNWVAEFTSWAPHLNVVEYHGSAKARSVIRQYEWHAGDWDGTHKGRTASYKYNVLLTTYEMVLADSSHLRGVTWEVLVVDEGHRLKNSGSKLFSLLNTFSFQHRVLLTGTPLQNNIGEMYNLLNFLQPASFPSLSSFEENFNDLTTAEKVEELKKLVAPHMLRRLKKDAMRNIPPKTERMVPVELTSIQAEYYRAMLTKNYQILRNTGKGVAQQSMLNIVMQLRKVCNHPYLIPGTEPESGTIEFLHEMRIKASAKLALLHSMLKILKREGHRVLIFSQMTKLLDILEDYLTVEFGPKTFERVDGSVSVGERQAAILRFNQDKTRFVFLLSTRSCGLGINLATADTVVIYDSDFNPHADIQAMNRAHRIGQSNRLLVYRLVVRASVEERILQLAKKKLMLDQLFVNKSGSQKEVEDILKWGTEELFSYLADGDGKDATNEGSRNKSDVGGDAEQRHRRRGGGLGDVYKDKCTDGSQKIIWDEKAILKLLDRSNLDLGSIENIEGDMENDMLGSVKSVEWNDEPAEEQAGSELPPTTAEGITPQSNDKKEDPAASATEENEWDRLLRVRWEKNQNEEEAALGRGKRLRKAVSYKEVFTSHTSEAFYESGNDEDEPEREPEYTPAGRALKEKFAKLRARQKERIAQRRLSAFRAIDPQAVGPESVQPFLHTSEVESQHNARPAEVVQDQASPINLENAIMSQTSETAMRNKSEQSSRNRLLKNTHKSIQSPHLDLSVKPPGSLNPDIFFPSHQFQSTNMGGSSLPPTTILGPVLGLCAPNAPLRDSASKHFHPYLELPRPSKQQTRVGMAMPEFPLRLAPAASSSINLDLAQESATASVPRDTSEFLCHPIKSTIREGLIPSPTCPSTLSRGKGPLDHLDSLGAGFSSFQDKLPAPNFILDEKLNSKVPLSAKSVSNSCAGLLPNLSLDMNGRTMTHSVQDLPTMPLLPNFRFPIDESMHPMREVPPVLGLGQVQPTFPSLPENHKKVLDNILMRTGPASNKFKKRLKMEASWSEDELDALWIGVRRHGRGNWDAMLRDPKLKFSKYRTYEELAERWEMEQLKILDGPAFPPPKLTKPTFPNISDGMMTRALLGSRFTGLDGPDNYGPHRFHSHLTDFQLGHGDLPHVEPTGHFSQMHEHYSPIPSWKQDKFKPIFTGDSSAGPSDRPGTSKLSLEPLFLPSSLSGNFQQRDDDQTASKYLKLPSLLDESLNRLRNSHNISREAGFSGPFPDTSKKPNLDHPPINVDASAGNSSANKLPHWLREAVNMPPKPPEPELPPNVSAIAQSVRLLYGEAQPTIPPFTVPGPPLFLPKDPRKRIKKRWCKLRKLQQVTPEIGTLSSIPPAPPFPTIVPSTTPSTSLSWVEPTVTLPSLNLNLLSTPSSSTLLANRKKSGIMLSPSPEVLNLVASCVAPGSHMPSSSFLTSDSPAMRKGFEHLEPSGDVGSLDLMKGERGKRKARSSLLNSWGKLPEDHVVDRIESGDSSETHSDACEVQVEVEEISSEETVSDNHHSEHE